MQSDTATRRLFCLPRGQEPLPSLADLVKARVVHVDLTAGRVLDEKAVGAIVSAEGWPG